MEEYGRTIWVRLSVQVFVGVVLLGSDTSKKASNPLIYNYWGINSPSLWACVCSREKINGPLCNNQINQEPPSICYQNNQKGHLQYATRFGVATYFELFVLLQGNRQSFPRPGFDPRCNCKPMSPEGPVEEIDHQASLPKGFA